MANPDAGGPPARGAEAPVNYLGGESVLWLAALAVVNVT